jgi:class 3 adenylate cyclase
MAVNLHTLHPALAVHAGDIRPSMPVPDLPRVEELQEQVANLVLRHRDDTAEKAQLAHEVERQRLRIDVLEALIRCDEKIRAGEVAAAHPAAAATPMAQHPSSRALVPMPPTAASHHPASHASAARGSQSRPPWRAMSALSTEKDRVAAVEPLLLERTKDLQAAMEEVVETSAAVTRHWHEDTDSYERQLCAFRTELAAVRADNDVLRKRVAEEVLNKRQTANMTNVLAKLRAQRRTREASLLRLEALERSAMTAHDDQAYLSRWVARDYPHERVAFVFVDSLSHAHLVQNAPHLERLVVEMYESNVARVAIDVGANFNHRRATTSMFILQSAFDALAFVVRLNEALLAVEWPDTLVHDAAFAKVKDPTSSRLLFHGPRVRFGLSFGTASVDYSATLGRYYCFGNEVTAAGRVTSYARPGEICVSAAFRERLETELAGIAPNESPFGDLMTWFGSCIGKSAGVFSMLPPEYGARRALWKREYPSLSTLRAALPEWAAKFDNPLHWSKVVGDGPTLAPLAQRHTAVPRKQDMRSRALLCAAQRALEAHECERMAALDPITMPGKRAPLTDPVLLVGSMGNAHSLRAGLPGDVFHGVNQLFIAEVRQASERYGGYWVKADGDAFMVAFERLRDAVNTSCAIHRQLLTVQWPSQVFTVCPLVTVNAVDFDGNNVKRIVSGAVAASMAVDRCTGVRTITDPTTFSVDYIGQPVHIACQLAAHARPGETLIGETGMNEFRIANMTLDYSCMGQGALAIHAVKKPEEAVTVLPTVLAARFKLWAAQQAKQASGPNTGASSTAQSTASPPKDGAVGGVSMIAKTVADKDAALKMRLLLRFHRDPNNLNVPPAVARAMQLMPKLASDRRKLLRKLQHVETAAMFQRDDKAISVPPVGHAAIAVFDLEGSDKLFKAFGPLFVAAQRHYNALVLSIAHDHEGYRVKHNGYDAFVYAFPDAGVALRFCAAVQVALLSVDWPADMLRHELSLRVKEVGTGTLLYNGLRCRMGISSGYVVTSHDPHTLRTDYAGPVIHAAGRVSRCGRGGDIVVSGEAMTDIQRLSAETDGEVLAGLTVAAKRDPANKGATLNVVYPASLTNRSKNLLDRAPQAAASTKDSRGAKGKVAVKEPTRPAAAVASRSPVAARPLTMTPADTENSTTKGSNWWRAAHSNVQPVQAELMTPQSLAAVAQKAAEEPKKPPTASPAGKRAAPAPTPKGGKARGPPQRTPTQSPPAAIAAAPVGAAAVLTSSQNSASGVGNVAGVPTHAALPDGTVTKLQDLCRRLHRRLEATQEAVHGVPSFEVSYSKLGRELQAILTTATLVIEAAAQPVNPRAGTNQFLAAATTAFNALADATVDLREDERVAQQRQRALESKQGVCQRCGGVFRNHVYCSATGLLHLPRSSFYVYNLGSNVISTDEVRMLFDHFARLDPHEFGRLAFNEVQSLAAEFGESLDETTYGKRMCRASDGCLSFDDLLRYLYPSATEEHIRKALSEAWVDQPSTPSPADVSSEFSPCDQSPAMEDLTVPGWMNPFAEVEEPEST